LLREAAKSAPDLPAVVTSTESWSYARCLERSEQLAAGLRARSLRRFGCRIDNVGELISMLAASAATGSEACVYPAHFDDQSLAQLARAFGHPAVVSDCAVVPPDVPAIPVDELAHMSGIRAKAPESPRVLILTTGTTGRPKGVVHEWSRLVAGVRHPDERPGGRWLLTYNMNQFAGVQVLLHCLVSRATLVVPESNQPGHAVQAMREHAVTHVSATPTFWRLVTGKLDASSARSIPLQQITLGGEAPTEGVLDAVGRLFPNARISQVYAATELGSVVAVSDGRPGLPVSLLERDKSADVQVRIVDGELQVRTRLGMVGYHAEDSTQGNWRGTGDLVEVRGDRIHFVGRTTEIVNVGGVKVSPLMVEDVLNRIDGVLLGRAYGRPNPITGQIVAADVAPAEGVDEATLKAEVRRACEVLPPAARPRVVRVVPELEIRGQKLVRIDDRGGS
jgi:acyl-coenzyme A synthetase/AMP-(fatty) acid ligase